MTFEEWTVEVTEDFQAAGFTVKEHLGFPFMPNRSAPCLSASVEVASSGVHPPSGVPTELT